MTIRTATSEDATSISKLMKELVEEHHQRDNYYKPSSRYHGLKKYIHNSLKDENKLMLVAEINDKIIAYLIAAIEEAPFYSSEKKIGVIADTVVNKTYRRRGTLTAMFRFTLDWFRKQEVNYIELSVNSKNQAAIAAWQKMGFETYKLRMKKAI